MKIDPKQQTDKALDKLTQLAEQADELILDDGTFADEVPVNPLSVGIGAKQQTIGSRQVVKQRHFRSEPLLVTDGYTPTEIEKYVESITNGSLFVMSEAIQRGKFTFRDIEALTAALIVMGLRDGENQATLNKISAVTQQLNRLTAVVRARTMVEIQEKTADRVDKIERKLRNLKYGGKLAGGE